MTSQEEKTDFVTAPPIQKEVDNSASNLYLLRHPREDNNTNRQRINAKLLKIHSTFNHRQLVLNFIKHEFLSHYFLVSYFNLSNFGPN